MKLLAAVLITATFKLIIINEESSICYERFELGYFTLLEGRVLTSKKTRGKNPFAAKGSLIIGLVIESSFGAYI